MNKLLKKNKQKKIKTPKWTSTNGTEGPMRGATQIENTIKICKNYTNNISMRTMSSCKRTILQVTKCTGVIDLSEIILFFSSFLQRNSKIYLSFYSIGIFCLIFRSVATTNAHTHMCTSKN